MKLAALYLRVSAVDQHPETQLLDLRKMAAQSTDQSPESKAKRLGLDQMMADARGGCFDVVMAGASDRLDR